jgi:hypothetical protein
MFSEYKSQTDYLRELSKRLQYETAKNENSVKRKRWADHNDLVARQKPLIWVCPDDNGAWLELIPLSSLKCTDEKLREIELRLLKYLYQAKYLKDDFVFENRLYFNYPGEYTGYMYGDDSQQTAWGIKVEKHKVSDKAYHLNNFLKTDADYETLLSHEVDFIPDENEKQRLKEIYTNALNGLLEIEFQLPYSVLVQSHLIELVHLQGLEEMLYMLYDDEERLSKVLNHMGESKARLLKKLEKNRLLFDNRINIYTGSGSLGYTNDSLKKPEDVLLSDMWGFADAQEFSNVSPEMFVKFAVHNQKIGLNLFGRGCYGCCEPLDGKYDAIYKNITNIRRLSVSPWSNIDEAVEKINKKAIFSWKPNPAKICTGFDEDEIYTWLKEIAFKTKDCFVEIILKDIRTCGNSNQYLVKFIELADKAFNL